MKSIFLLALFICCFYAPASAQKRDVYAERPGSLMPSLARVDNLTRDMSSNLRLNEAQYIRLRSVNQIKLARLNEIEYEFTDAEQRRQKAAELEAQYEAECSRILTPTQLSVFRAEQNQQPDQPSKTDSNEGGLG
ncbi:hypothetical protein H8B13_14550 [Hymenobacter sp. BT188]|uniref:hypothetical protein n=1 Tax=Hymenobacter sp. BT188 TaxID=2763504 RepID=UPI001650EB5B|nr:hypothetical protein [Hymenobacter sp. BT188]MBC6608044.1 hypothetical protein [Hymenobacter sp. BT188]